MTVLACSKMRISYLNGRHSFSLKRAKTQITALQNAFPTSLAAVERLFSENAARARISGEFDTIWNFRRKNAGLVRRTKSIAQKESDLV